MVESTVKLSSLLVSADAEQDGEWQPCPTIPGVSLLVRPIDYPAYAIERDVAMQRLQRQHGPNPSPKDRSVALGRLCAKHLLLDWKGFDKPYDQQVALEILTDPQASNFVSAVLAASVAASEAKLEFVDDVVKN